MTDNELLPLVTAILFHVKDKNPPHGVFETREEATQRTIAQAKQLVFSVRQS